MDSERPELAWPAPDDVKWGCPACECQAVKKTMLGFTTIGRVGEEPEAELRFVRCGNEECGIDWTLKIGRNGMVVYWSPDFPYRGDYHGCYSAVDADSGEWLTVDDSIYL